MNLTQILTALSAANEAILGAASHEELCQLVCDAMVEGGKLVGTAVLVAERGSWSLYSAGEGIDAFSRFKNPVGASSACAQDIASIAIHTGRSCVVTDYQNDERVRAWRDEGMSVGIGAAVAIPIGRKGSFIGAFLLFLTDKGFIDAEIVSLMERTAGSVAFALDKFAREKEKDRIARMVSALSSTNEAIMRAETREKLYRLVCDAAVLGGKFTATSIVLTDSNRNTLHVVASTGPSSDAQRTLKVAITPDQPGDVDWWKSPSVPVSPASAMTISPTKSSALFTPSRGGWAQIRAPRYLCLAMVR